MEYLTSGSQSVLDERSRRRRPGTERTVDGLARMVDQLIEANQQVRRDLSSGSARPAADAETAAAMLRKLRRRVERAMGEDPSRRSA